MPHMGTITVRVQKANNEFLNHLSSFPKSPK